VHTKFKELLHQHKLEVFRVEHHQKNADEIARECMHVRDEVLEQNYHYHFRGLPDANRAEIINMINNYMREAVLPPVVEKLVTRQITLEKRVIALEALLARTLEALSEPRTNGAAQH